MAQFTHLHVHSHYSILDGMAKVPDLVEKCLNNGMQAMAEKLMKEAVKKYKDVYFIQTNATNEIHSTSVDGIHPSDYGYTLWAESIKKPIVRILKKYGIR